jgi:hypothetical protein
VGLQRNPTSRYLDVWDHFRLLTLPCDKFPAEEICTITCKARSETQLARFTPVLVDMHNTSEGIHSKFVYIISVSSSNSTLGYRVAELRLVLRPRLNQQQPNRDAGLLAHVLWRPPIPPRPSRANLYQVTQEFDMHGHRKSGIIDPSHIKGICPLAPSFGEKCDPAIMSNNCFERTKTYHINHYASHSFFRRFRWQ